MNIKLVIGILVAFMLGFLSSEYLQKQNEKKLVLLNDNQQSDTNPTEQDTFSNKPSQIEDFDDFFYKFRNDSIFQISRVQFPLRFEGLSDGYTKEEKSNINKQDWAYKQFFSSEEYYVEISKSPDIKEKETGKRLLSFNGIENGIYVSYEFRLLNNKWFLIKWIDRST